MSGADKIIEKMKRQPNGISMAEADKVLVAVGYRLARQKEGLALSLYRRGRRRYHPQKENPLKAVYVKDILSRIPQRRPPE